MARLCGEIEINGRKCWTLFDSEARHSYVVPGAVRGVHLVGVRLRRTASLGGKKHEVDQACLVSAQVEGRWVTFHASVVDDIAEDADGRRIEVLFGGLAMKEWGIRPDTANDRLDFTHYTTHFVEF